MEIAHIHTGALRVFAKVFLLIVLVFLLAKVLLTLLGLAVVGGVTFCCARAVYNRRESIQRLAGRSVAKLVATVAAILQTSIVLLLTVVASVAVFLPWLVMRLGRCLWTTATQKVGPLALGLGQTLATLATTIAVPVGRTVASGARRIWTFVRQVQQVVAQVVCGTVIEAGSGALVGALLGLILLQHINPVETRVCAPALFGTFLGVTLGLSRMTWAREDRTSQLGDQD